MKVLVFGSRNWLNQKAVEKVLRGLPPGTVVIEGDARGVDRIAGFVARLLGFTVRVYPALANNRTWPSAGPLRNQEMLDCEHPSEDGTFIDRAFCFHEDPNLGKGSRDMVARLRKAQPPIVVEVSIDRLP